MTPLGDLTPGRVAAYTWWFITKGGEHSEVEKFRARLWIPPKGTTPDPRSPWAPENETAAFAALKAALNPG